MMPRLRQVWFPVLGVPLIGLLLYQHVRLAEQNVRLRDQIARDASERVRPGDVVIGLSGEATDGSHQRRSIEDAHSGAMVIGFSASCGYCQQNTETWRRLASRARAAGVAVFWVTRDAAVSLEQFSGPDESAGDVVLADPGYWTYSRLKLRLVPQTLIIGPDGSVRDARVGVLTERDEREIGRSLEVLIEQTSGG